MNVAGATISRGAEGAELMLNLLTTNTKFVPAGKSISTVGATLVAVWLKAEPSGSVPVTTKVNG